MIQKIEIKNLNKIKEQTLEFAPRLTAIFAPNGSGKTSLAQALTIERKDNVYDLSLLFKSDTEVKLTNEKGEQNTLKFVEQIYDDIYALGYELKYTNPKSAFAPRAKLFSTNGFAANHIEHSMGNGLVNISREKKELNILEQKLKVLSMLKVEIANFENNGKQSKEILGMMAEYAPRFVREVKSFERRVERAKSGSHSLKSMGYEIDKKEILAASDEQIEKMRNGFIWSEIIGFCFSTGRGRLNLYRRKIDSGFVDRSLKNLEAKFASKLDAFNKKSEFNKGVLENIKASLLKTHLKDKFVITEDFNVMNSDGQIIILSSGELKYLMLLKFLFSAKEGDFIILDDPFSSFDTNFQDYIVEAIKEATIERGIQILFLTHNENALFMMSGYLKVKSKDNNIINSYYSLLLTNDKESNFFNFEHRSIVKNYLSYIKNTDVNDEIRIMYSRKFLERLIKTTGGNSISDFVKKGVFKIFGKSIVVNSAFQKMIHRWSHDDENLYDYQYNVTASKWVLESVMDIIDGLEIK